MYRTVKHELLLSGPMGNKSVYDLPGIGVVRGGRLEMAGITSASQLMSLYQSMGRDKFESFLNNTCGQNSLWTGMTINALDDYNRQSFSTVSLAAPLKSNAIPDASAMMNKPVMAASTSVADNKDDRLKKLSERIASLQLKIQQLEENIEEFHKENISNYEIVQLLQKRADKNGCENKALADKVSELISLPKKIESFALHIFQIELNVKRLDKEILLKQEQEFTKISGVNEYLQSRIEAHSGEIKELNKKTSSTDNRMSNLAFKCEELTDLFGIMKNFESRIQNAEKNNGQLNKKLTFMYCVNAAFLLVFTCLIVATNHVKQS